MTDVRAGTVRRALAFGGGLLAGCTVACMAMRFRSPAGRGTRIEVSLPVGAAAARRFGPDPAEVQASGHR